jgi:carbamoyltransferase
MIIFGINSCSHDASVSVVKNGEIVFAAHSERYSKKKNDWFTNRELIKDALQYGYPDQIAYYEKPLLKKTRLILKGGFGGGKPWFEGTELGGMI